MTTPSRRGDGRPDPGLTAVMSERRRLTNLGYRLLGSLAEAEDAVQESGSPGGLAKPLPTQLTGSPSTRRRVRAAQAPAGPATQQAAVVRAFKRAWEAKDIDALIGLLDPEATAIADGGGLAITFLRPIEGGSRSRAPGSRSPTGGLAT